MEFFLKNQVKQRKDKIARYSTVLSLRKRDDY